VEKTRFIIILALSAGLLAGGLVLGWKNRGILFGKAQISQFFVKQQPVDKPGAEDYSEGQKQETKNSNQQNSEMENESHGDKESEEKISAKQPVKSKKSKAKKAETAEIKWCDANDYYAQKKVIFNEIAWMGTSISYFDEWIELKNISGQVINLNGWQLQNKKRGITISFSEGNSIAVNGLLILERTDDNTLPDIKADLVYSGSLANSKEELLLFDKNCVLQDYVIAAPDWPGGNNETKQTMERQPNFLWQTSKDPGGTPKKENGSGDTTAIDATTQAVLTSGSDLNAVNEDPARIFINEIMYNPQGSDESREWVEIYNGGDAVNLEGWKLNTGGTNHSLSLIQGSFILPAASYAIIANSTSTEAIVDPSYRGNFYRASFSLRNTTSAIEQIFLKRENDIIDQAGYESSWNANGDGKSLQRKSFDQSGLDANNWRAEIPTLGAENVFNNFILSNATVSLENATSTTANATTTQDLIITEPAIDNATTTAGFLVVINEIAWMGTATSTYDEWIELYNATGAPLDLAGWRIDKNGGDFIKFEMPTTANATTTIESYGFYLIERKTASKKASAILDSQGIALADLFTGLGSGLNNNGEMLELFDPQGNKVDWVDCRNSWFAGTGRNKGAFTMARRLPLSTGNDQQSWENSTIAGGTARRPNY